MKKIIFLGSSEKDFRSFSALAVERIEYVLNEIRNESRLSPQEFKYMPTVGTGVYELRVKVEKQYRMFYIAKFEEAIYVLHAFVKKTQKTSKKDIELGTTRYKILMRDRRG